MNKLTSRKFFVFLVWVIIFFLVVIMRCSENILTETIKAFSLVSIIYIGGNTASKFINDGQIKS